MGLLGAILGGTVGLMLGGPLGAILGGAIGAQVLQDPRPEELGGQPSERGGAFGGYRPSFAPPPPPPPPPPRGQAHPPEADPALLQEAFMVALISLAAKVAKADGRVSQEEVAAFDGFLARDLGMPPQERRFAARIFNQARDSGVPIAALTSQVRMVLGGQPDRLRDLVALLLQIAWADGVLAASEESLIRRVAADLGLSARVYEEIKALFARGDLAAAYAVLEVSPEASDEQIKKSYRRLAREYHPDIVASKGLPEDFTKFATQKLQAINEAYEMVRKARGSS